MTRKASAAAAIVAFATVGSAMFGGTALAGGNHGDNRGNGVEPVVNNTGGPGGAAGEADGCIIIDSTVTQSPVANDEGVSEASFTCIVIGGDGGPGYED
jgi:hypothetical protein